jgi:hypothetical protein
MTKTYPSKHFSIEADLANASAPIFVILDDERYNTPFQTADACHNEDEAISLVAEWLATMPTLS